MKVVDTHQWMWWTRINGSGGHASMKVVDTLPWKWRTRINISGGHAWLRLSRYNWHTVYSVWSDWLPKRSRLAKTSSTSSYTRSVVPRMTTGIFVLAIK